MYDCCVGRSAAVFGAEMVGTHIICVGGLVRASIRLVSWWSVGKKEAKRENVISAPRKKNRLLLAECVVTRKKTLIIGGVRGNKEVRKKTLNIDNL